MSLSSAALSLLSGKAADWLAEFRREARSAKVIVEDGQLHVCLAEHVDKVRRWSQSITMLTLQRDRLLDESYINLDLTVGLARYRDGDGHGSCQVDELFRSGESVAILGRPGAGKTTTLQKIAATAVAERDHGRGGVPLLVRLRELRELRLAQWLLAELGISVIVPSGMSPAQKARWENRILVRLLDQLSAVLLLDGLDETEHSQRKTVEADIAEIALSARSCRIVLTCRTADFRAPFKGVHPYTILPLTEAQVAEFAGRWLGKRDAGDFVRAVAAAPYAGTHLVPLMLAHLCTLFARDRELPKRPIDVYEQIVSLMVEQWDRERGVSRRSRYADLNWRGKERFLAAMSYQLTMAKRRGSFDEGDLLGAYPKIAAQFGLPNEEAVDVVEEVESHTGLVLRAGPKSFEFIHLSIQEYLTAMHARGLADSVSPLFPEFPNELALVAASSPVPEQYLERILCLVVTNAGALRGHSFLPVFLGRLNVERPAIVGSAKFGWLVLGFEQMLGSVYSKGAESHAPGIEDLLSDLPWRESVVLAARQADHYPKEGYVDLIPRHGAYLPRCLSTAYTDRVIRTFAVSDEIARASKRWPRE